MSDAPSLDRINQHLLMNPDHGRIVDLARVVSSSSFSSTPLVEQVHVEGFAGELAQRLRPTRQRCPDRWASLDCSTTTGSTRHAGLEADFIQRPQAGRICHRHVRA